MSRYGMLIDLKSCNGCRACMMVCKANHSIPVGEYAGLECYRIWPMEVELGKFPYVVRNLTPLLCMQCEDPPCVGVCPVPGAIYKREDGIVLIDEKKCNGCKLCVPSCPYDALYFREDKQVVDKCTLCVENIDEGLLPECVRTCPAQAMFFGDLENPENQISKLIKQWDARPFRPELKTKPSVYYTAHTARLRGTLVSKKTRQVVMDADITLGSPDKGRSNLTTTDSDGVFFFWNLEIRKRYTISIKTDGFVRTTRELYLDEEYTDLGLIEIPEL